MSKSISLLLSLALGALFGFALSRALPSAPRRETQPVAADQVATRVQEILRSPDPLHRQADLSTLLKNLGPEALSSVLQGFENSPLDAGEPEGVAVGEWWAALDPKAAFAWATTDWRAGCGTVVAAVSRIWAHTDPHAALEEVRKLRYPGQVEMAKEAIWAGWDESGQPGLADLLHQGAMVEQQRLAGIMARRRVTVLGIDGAIHWAETFPDESLRPVLSVRVASTAASMSPESARKVAEWATPKIAAATQPTGFPRRIGTRWIRHDPASAMAWLSSLPPGLDRDDGVAESFRDWMLADFPAAEAWIREQIAAGIPQWTEAAVSIFAKTNGMARPQESLEIVARLKDPELRDSATALLLVNWIKKDRAAAEAWLAQSDISQEVRERVEAGLKAPRPPPGTPLMPTGPLGHELPEHGWQR